MIISWRVRSKGLPRRDVNRIVGEDRAMCRAKSRAEQLKRTWRLGETYVWHTWMGFGGGCGTAGDLVTRYLSRLVVW